MKFVSYSHWEQLPASANQLFLEAEQQSMFLSRQWFETITQHSIDNNQHLILFGVVHMDRLLAILPMITSPQGSLHSLSSRFTSFYSLLIAKNSPQEAVLNCLAQGISEQEAHLIQLDPVDEHEEKVLQLNRALQNYGFSHYPYFRFYNWLHIVKGQSFAEYIEQRPAMLRNTLKRKRRKLQREYQVDIVLHTEFNVEQAFNEYQKVYQASWKANEFFADFTPALVKQFNQSGWLRLAILSVDQQPIAAQIWFVVHSKANIYRLVYDKKWKKYSPGSILTEHMMQYVIETDKVTEIDFLTGNERYKQDWMSVRKERAGIRFMKKQKQTMHPLKKIIRKYTERLIHHR